MAFHHHPQAGKTFFIESQLHGKVLDVQGENKKAGAKIIVYKKKDPPTSNQLWYEDEQTGSIRSALNDFALHFNGRGKHVTLEPAASHNQEQKWRFQDRRVVHVSGDVLDIKGESKSDGAEVIAYQYKGGPNQHWTLSRLG